MALRKSLTLKELNNFYANFMLFDTFEFGLPRNENFEQPIPAKLVFHKSPAKPFNELFSEMCQALNGFEIDYIATTERIEEDGSIYREITCLCTLPEKEEDPE